MSHGVPGIMAAAAALGLVLTYKGHGTRSVAPSGGNFTLAYSTVVGGSAPTAGDLVVWCVYADDPGGNDAFNSPSGWTQGNVTVGSAFRFWQGAKVAVSGDISSPPTLITSVDAQGGARGLWQAFTVSGTIASLAASTPTGYQGSSSAPNNQTANSSALNSPSVAITCVAKTGNDGSMNVGGITFDQSTTFANIGGYYTDADVLLGQKLDVGGASYTITGGDDGDRNRLFAGYISVNA